MKCVECGQQLFDIDNVKVCSYCKKTYTEKEIQDIKDVEMLKEDLEIWKKVQKFR